MAEKLIDIQHTAERIKQPTAGMWDDYVSEKQPFSQVSKYENDFNRYITDEWTSTLVEAGVGESTVTLSDARNGILVLTTDANEDDGVQLQLGGTAEGETTGESWAPAAGKNLWFETRIALNDVTQTDFFVGLHVEDTTFVASRGSDYIGFSSDDGDALLDVANAASSVVDSEAGVATLVDATYVKLGFKVTGLDKVEYYVNDALVATNLTNIPTGLMKLSLGILTGEAVADTLSIDYVIVAQNR